MSYINIDIDVNLFRAASLCASKEETRYYLMGVYVQPHPVKGAVIVATDGHRMFVAHDEEGKCTTPGIIATDPTLKAAAALAKEEGRVTVDDTGIVVVPEFYQSPKSGLVDGKYPDWAETLRPVLGAIAANKQGISSFNNRHVSDFNKIAALLGGKSAYVREVSFGIDFPSLILFPQILNVFGILMPCRTEELKTFPAFMESVLDREPAKAEAA